jgi:hypothetical protein
MPSKPTKAKSASKTATVASKPIPLTKHIELTLAQTPAGTTGTVDGEVLECIGRQSGGNTITLHAQLGRLGVNGATLAGCLNEKFGPKFKGNDFPGTMEVVACILLVRKKVAGGPSQP